MYGGPNADDMYDRFIGYGYVTDDPVLIYQTQLNKAAEYTAGMLRAVSESLPPAVKLPMVNGVVGGTVTVNPGQANSVNFVLEDNRPGTVTYRLVVDDVNSANDIISLSSQTVVFNSSPDLSLNEDPTQTDLPFHTLVTKEWNGLLANGSPVKALAGGMPHTLYIIGAVCNVQWYKRANTRAGEYLRRSGLGRYFRGVECLARGPYQR